jgi:YidC/Oxa1 family membrane protein insertase
MKTEQDADVEKRLLLAIVLSMAILFGTPYIYQKLNLTPQPEPAPVEVVQEPVVTPEAAPTIEEEVAPDQAGAMEPTEAEPQMVYVETEDLLLSFTNVGAHLTSARLKNYTSSGGEALEILPQSLPGDVGGVLRLRSSDSELDRLLGGATYEVTGPNAHREEGFRSVSFHLRQGNLEVTKRVLIPGQGYQLKLELKLEREGRPLPYAVQLGPGIGDLNEENTSDFQDPAVVFFQNNSVERYYIDDFEDGAQAAGNFRWAGIDSKYFAYILLCPSGIRNLLKTRLEAPRAGTGEEEAEAATLLGAVAELGEAEDFWFYIGPKRSEDLALVDPTLRELIDFGEWLGVLVKPLLVALKFLYRYAGNWGWSIILLTFLINLALFPFRYKQMASMQKMSAVQPKIKSIQEKYKRMKKDDPRKQQMNAEVMALYKKHGVNPLGGCLPLVLQMPILFAFYRMLYTSIELRGAPFMLWIQDLSKPDPYYITPIVMGATMVAQQKMTPATGDAAQRRMMMFLPIIFTFFFLQVSSGLAIYFLFSNVFGMALQFGLQKLKPELTAKGKKAAKKQKAKK